MKRIRRIRKKKKVYQKKWFWTFLLFIILAIALIYFLIFSHFFQVKNIEGPENLNSIIENGINKKLLFFETRSILLVNIDSIEKEILHKFPKIREVEIKKKVPRTLLVEIKEREKIGDWCEEECFALDTQGIIFEQSQDAKGLVIRPIDYHERQLGEQVIKEDVLSKIFQIKKKFKFTEFIIFSSKRLDAVSEQGWKVYFSLEKDIDWQLLELKILLDREIPEEKLPYLEYIDLRFTKVYYR